MKKNILFSNRNWKHELRLEIERLNEYCAKQLLEYLRGESANSDASKDPFKFLGEFSDPNSAELLAALDGLHSKNKMDSLEGVWRFTVLGKPSMLYNYSMSYTNDRWVQGLVTVYCPNVAPQYTFGIDNKAHFLYRYYDGNIWSKWRDITQDNKELIFTETVRATTVEKQLQATKMSKRNYVTVDGGTATIISKYNEHWDIVIRFAKVMANNLYSIDKVFLAVNHNKELSPEVSDNQYLLCQQNTSDMIGPVQVNRPVTGNSWVGGNHFYLNQQSGIKGAVTNSFSIMADGELVTQGSAYADVVTINVENTIFDPDVAPASGETVLSSPMITEQVSYRINGGEICVGVEHRYLKDVYVNIYYGMQSMFLPKKDDAGNSVNVQFITAHGGYYDWTVLPTGENVVRIKKGDAPNFNRFSQKHVNGHYQNSVLLPYGLGTHNYVNDAGDVFVYSGDKAYHVLVQNKEIAENEILSWMGVYNWNRPIVDDEYNYVYDYGNENISVTAKKAYDNISVPMPAYAANTLYKVTEGGANVSVQDVVINKMNLSAQAQGSICGFLSRV